CQQHDNWPQLTF
nr:immunoglobulin light chain junction region [Macaca mulatta]